MKKRSHASVALLTIASTVLLCGLMASCSDDQGNDPSDTTSATTTITTTEGTEATVADTNPTETEGIDTASENETSSEEAAKPEVDTKEEDTVEEETFVTPDSVIDAISPTHGETICVANAKVSEYNEKYSVGYGVNYIGTGDIYAPLPITLTWEDVGADCYRVRLSASADFSDSQVVLTAANTASFENPLTGVKYYWQVEAIYEDRTDVSAIFIFKTQNTPRTLFIDGVSNTRDIGGYAISKTACIRQGMIYRSGFLHEITETGLYQARELLGIKCELDFRTPGEGGAGGKSSLGEDITYYNFDGVFYMGMKDKERQTILANEIKIFADPNNYPMIIHCSLGRDRTGTAAMLIQALCGVSEKDLYKDYELSFFSTLGSNDTVENLLNNHVTPMLNYIKSYGKDGDSLKDCVEAFLLKIGVTQAEIDSIRSIMIQEVK